MNSDVSAYGLWPLVVTNAAVFIIFAISFARPQTGRDWRSFGAFSAFIVALFTEMYGFPLTIYLLSGWLGSAFPGIDPAHANHVSDPADHVCPAGSARRTRSSDRVR